VVWNKRDRSGNGTENGEWVVHITKSFSASRFGSKNNAYKEAVKFRDEQYKAMYKKFQDVYICENVQYREIVRKTKTYKYYRAKYYDKNGCVHEKNYNIEKLGDSEALELAKEKADPAKRWDLIKTYIKEDSSEV